MDGDHEELASVLSLAAPDAIELRHLRAFVAVAEELNFGRAAARLYLSAPALSRQIRALERLVGCELLRRNTHQVSLTLAGEALLDCARKLLADLDRGVAATRLVGGELAGRIAKFWAPIETSSGGDDLQAIRDSTEAMYAQFEPPPEIGMRSVNAGGVPSLLLAPRPDAPTTAVHLHGGGFVSGSAFGNRPLAGALAAATDSGILVPEYRLAPEHPFPAALEDAMRAYLWIVDSGVPPEQVTLVGDSAGGGLVVSVLLSLREQNLPLPGGAALLCPSLDPTCSTLRDMWSHDKQRLLRTVNQIRAYMELYLDGHPIDDPVVSPLLADLNGLPPLLIQVGTGDIVVDEVHRFAERARDHGVDVRLELYSADTHVFHLFWSFLPEAADAIAQVGRFAKEVRAGATAPGSRSGTTR